MSATAEEVATALAPFRDHLNLLGVKRQGARLLGIGAIFADDLTPDDARTRIVACFDYSAELAKVMLVRGATAALLNQGSVFDVLFVFFDPARYEKATEWAVDLYEERGARLVRSVLVDWNGRELTITPPDTFAGRVRAAIGQEQPLYGAEDDDVAHRHVAAWHERIAARANRTAAPIRLINCREGWVLDLPRPAGLASAVDDLRDGGVLDLVRLDRHAALTVVRNQARDWSLELGDPANGALLTTTVQERSRVNAAVIAYASGDRDLKELAWHREPVDS